MRHHAEPTFFIDRQCDGYPFCEISFSDLRALFLYCLAQSAEKYEVEINAFVVLPDRWLRVVSGESAGVSLFAAWLHQHTAKCLADLSARNLDIWKKQRVWRQRLDSARDVLAAIVRVLRSPALAGRCGAEDRVVQLRSVPADYFSGPLVALRPRAHFLPENSAPVAGLRVVPPAFERLSRTALVAKLLEALPSSVIGLSTSSFLLTDCGIELNRNRDNSQYGIGVESKKTKPTFQ